MEIRVSACCVVSESPGFIHTYSAHLRVDLSRTSYSVEIGHGGRKNFVSRSLQPRHFLVGRVLLFINESFPISAVICIPL